MNGNPVNQTCTPRQLATPVNSSLHALFPHEFEMMAGRFITRFCLI